MLRERKERERERERKERKREREKERAASGRKIEMEDLNIAVKKYFLSSNYLHTFGTLISFGFS